MMNVRLIAIFSALAIGVPSIVDATTDDFRRVLMNHDGNVHEKCNDMDWESIDEILAESTTLVKSNELTHRRLYPIYCKSECQGFVKGTCRHTNCLGYRRLRFENEPDQELCNDEQLEYINDELKYLMNTDTITSLCHDMLEEMLPIMCQTGN